MNDEKRRSNIRENLVRLYLRLNGFFVTGFIVHALEEGRNRTEVDALAIRLPYNAEPERDIGPDPLLSLSPDYTDLVICEVKAQGQSLQFNKSLTSNEEAIKSVIRWSGLFKEDELPKLARNLHIALGQGPLPSKEPPTVLGPRNARVRCFLFSPERKSHYDKQPWFISGPDIFDYVHRCLSPGIDRPSCSVTYDFGLWGESEFLVRYFKGRKGPDAGDIEQLYTSCGIARS